MTVITQGMDNLTPTYIDDNTVVNITWTVTDDLVLDHVDVRLYIEHTYRGDLILTLSNSVHSVELAHNQGNGHANYGGGPGDPIIFAAGAASILSDYPESDGVGGACRPDVDDMGIFAGDSSADTWTLAVEDTAGGDTGAVITAELVLSDEPEGDLPSFPAPAPPRQTGRTWPPAPNFVASLLYGDFNIGTDYVRHAFAVDNGSLYQALQPVTSASVAPAEDPTNWRLVLGVGPAGAAAASSGLSFGGDWAAGSHAAWTLVRHDAGGDPRVYYNTAATSNEPPSAPWVYFPIGQQGAAGAAGAVGETVLAGHFTGPWDDITDYVVTNLVEHFGSVWYATDVSGPATATQEPPTTPSGLSDYWLLAVAAGTGEQLLKWGGEWDSDDAPYGRNTLVTKDGFLFVNPSTATSDVPSITSSNDWHEIRHDTPQVVVAGTPRSARKVVFQGGSVSFDTDDLPNLLKVSFGVLSSDIVAQSFGTTHDFTDVVAKSGDFTIYNDDDDNPIPPQVAMDIGGMVHLRGRLLSHVSGLREVLDDPIPEIYWPERDVKQVVGSNGGPLVAVVGTDGVVKVEVGDGDDIWLDALHFPSAIAFGNTTSVELVPDDVIIAVDPDNPLVDLGEYVYGSFTVGSTELSSSQTLFTVNATSKSHWHFEGDMDWEFTTGLDAGETGTVSVNSDNVLKLSSSLDSHNPGVVKFTVHLKSLLLTQG